MLALVPYIVLQVGFGVGSAQWHSGFAFHCNFRFSVVSDRSDYRMLVVG
jgi:hypothetical protein